MRAKYLSVVDGKRLNISQFPNFSCTGSVYGMKRLYYGEDALLVRCGSYIYYVGNESSSTAFGRHIYKLAH